MNFDSLKDFPNQILGNDPTECVGITTADIVGNIIGQVCSSDFSYAMGLLLEGVEPTTVGENPLFGIESAVAYGVLPRNLTTFTAQTMGELYSANADNYTAQQKKTALSYAQRGIKNVLGMGETPYDSIVCALQKYQQGISVPVSWFDTFMDTDATGILPNPTGSFTNHNIAIYGIDSHGLLIGKPWLGESFGDGGYIHISKFIINVICQGAYTFDSKANRWFSLLGILLLKGFPPSIVAQLLPLAATA